MVAKNRSARDRSLTHRFFGPGAARRRLTSRCHRRVRNWNHLVAKVTNAAAAAPGTLRGDFAQRVDRNIVHGSDSVENGIREIDIFFTGAELFTYRASFTTQL
ncbi:MAG: nucleoside-diphosphate kinase [Pseudorhodoplanes sp.]|nr:nucleoside-diphosphate kinase [Pseudorhodoplanes sp.]